MRGGVTVSPFTLSNGSTDAVIPCQLVDRPTVSSVSLTEYQHGASITMDMKSFINTLTVSANTIAYITDAVLRSQTAYGMAILSYLNDNLIDGYVPTQMYGNGSAKDKPRHQTMNGEVRKKFCEATGKSPATISETYQAIFNHEKAAQYFTIEAPATDDGVSRIKVDFAAAQKLFKSGDLVFRIDRKPVVSPVKNAATSRDSLMGGLDRVVTAITTNTDGAFKVGDKVTPLFGSKGKKGQKVLTPDGETQKALMLSKAIAVVNAIDPTMLSDKGLAVIQTVEAVAS